MAESQLPIAVFLTTLEQNEVMKYLEELPVNTDKPDVNGFFVWNLETKYYTSTIRIKVTEDLNHIDPDFLTAVETVCIIVPGKPAADENELEQVRSWTRDIDSSIPSVSVRLLFYCGSSSSDNFSCNGPSPALSWCLDNDFELVEMSPEKEEGDNETRDEDTDDLESDDRCYGISRVRDALACASWPNMQLKESKHSTRSTSAILAACSREATGSDTHKSPDSAEKKASDAKKQKEAFIDDLLGFDDEDKLFSAVNANDEDDEATFDCLFQQLAKFREKADSMPHDERKIFAEQITLKFWNAINGDDSEIEGLDDD